MVLKLHSLIPTLLLFLCRATAQQSTSSEPVTPAKIQHEETIIVTGTYKPIPLEESDRSIAVVDLSRSRLLYNTWVDGLRLDPSLDVRQRAPGVQGDLSIRGSSFSQSLVLVDGLRVNDAQSGHHNLDLPIPFASMDKIEILHGSGSTMYGSDAVGGAVNFITGAPTETALVAGTGAGNSGANQQYGSFSYSGRRISEVMSFTRDLSSGFMVDRDYRNLALSSESRLASRLGTTAILIGLSDRAFGADQFYGDFNSWERTKGWFVGSSQDLGDSTHAAFGYRRHTDEFILLRGRPSIYENNHITESYQLAVRRHDLLPKGLNLYSGVEAYRDVIDSNNLGYRARNQGAIYAELSFTNFKRITFASGTRIETYSGGHIQLSPQLSFGYRLSNQLRLRASLSHAFRLPTYTDLYYQDPANLGNPNLKPERAWGYEAGVLWKVLDRVSNEVTVFVRRERDGIDYVRSSLGSPWRAANIDRLNFAGLEILTKATRGQQTFAVGYAGIYAGQESTGMLTSKYVRNHPVHQATGGWFGALPGKVLLRARIGVTNRFNQGVYPLAEMAAGRTFGPVSPYFKVNNLTNTGYAEIENVRMPGRSYVAGFEFRFARSNSRR
jgi:iron complex outermembrane receptor protein